jgi:hypothetical protein
MTLTGLTLGAAQAAATAGFKLSSNVDIMSAGVNALAITVPVTPASPTSSAQLLTLSAMVCVCVFALF